MKGMNEKECDSVCAPESLWAVVDKTGYCTLARDRRLAEAKAIVYDDEYPSLAPHRVVCYQLVAA